MAEVPINSTFRHLGGKSVHELDSPGYREYRRMWEENPRAFLVADFPIHLDLEATARCNLRCLFCRTTYNTDNYPKGLLDIELFKRIIDQGSASGLKAIKFNWRGEPLLHPHLVQMIAYAKRKGILDVFFNTNAQLLTGGLAEELIKSGLDRITISVEGTNRETYEENRVGGSFELLLKNLQNLWEARQRTGLSNPKIRIQSVLIPELVGREKEYELFWHHLADEVACLELQEEVDYSRNTGRVDKDWSCPQLWQRMVIAADGKVLPCNMDHNCTLVLGNADLNGIRDLWLGEKLQRLREIHREGESHIVPACDRCPLRAIDIDKKRRRKDDRRVIDGS
jgi:radical SAM protein with 4Fe4S-binding SPASM domain